MPHNRFQVFFDLVGLRYDVLLKNGLYLFLFALPLIVVFFLKIIVLGNLESNFASGSIDQAAYVAAVFHFSNLINAGYVLAFAILGIAFAGVVRINRLLVWYQPISYHEDFARGIKDNWKQDVLLFALLGFLVFLSEFISALILLNQSTASQFIAQLASVLPLCITAVVVLPAFCFACAASGLYRDSFGKMIRIGFGVYFRTFFASFGLIILLGGLFGLLFLNNLIALAIVFGLLWLLEMPLASLIWNLYSFAVFDKYINRRLFPDYVDKGVWRGEKEESSAR